MDKKTSLYEKHLELNGKLTPFAGYLLPIQYTGIIKEHLAVRENVGIFDVSHMGQFIIKGKDALENLNNIMSNDFTNMFIGQCKYTLMLNETGGQLDDLIVNKLSEDTYLLIVNASNTEKDFIWITNNLINDVTINDISDNVSLLALQGPNSKKVLSKICNVNDLPDKSFTFKSNIKIANEECIVFQTGYTGELGYEIATSHKSAPIIWDALISAGSLPCGLGARDTLRIEASMPLYGHELNENIHALSTNLNYAIKLDKSDFIGKDALLNNERVYVRVGLKTIDRGIVREHCDIYLDDIKIGYTTSGTFLPYLNGSYSMAYIKKEYNIIGSKLYALVRDKKLQVELVELPFYKREEK